LIEEGEASAAVKGMRDAIELKWIWPGRGPRVLIPLWVYRVFVVEKVDVMGIFF